MNFNDLFKNKITYKLFAYKSCTHIYDLALNKHKGWYVIKYEPVCFTSMSQIDLFIICVTWYHITRREVCMA